MHPRTSLADRRFDQPAHLPAVRGPVSEALLDVLVRDPDHGVDPAFLRWDGSATDACADDDLQLALWLAYELHYRGLAGVDDGWEHQPDLITARTGWERSTLDGLKDRLARTARPNTVTELRSCLEDLARSGLPGDDGPAVSGWLMKHASREQFAEFLIHRSLYHLKEADPHSWGIPRLSGAVKAAMITIQTDEYGQGQTGAMHAQLFRDVMIDWALDARYAGYLDQVPGVTLLASNVMSLFGLHRRWRGALVGHLTLFEMTSSGPNARYARAHRRLGGGERAARFFDEHVVADAVHEQIAMHELAVGLARDEPALVGDIAFGAQCAALTDQLFAVHALEAWNEGRSSLRPRTAERRDNLGLSA